MRLDEETAIPSSHDAAPARGDRVAEALRSRRRRLVRLAGVAHVRYTVRLEPPADF